MSELTFEYITIVLAGLTTIFIVTALYDVKRNKLYNESKLLSRNKEINIIVSQIQTGQSSAIIGAFGHERTMILRDIFDKKSDISSGQVSLIFSYLSIDTLKKDCSQAEFWEEALSPINEQYVDKSTNILKIYETCKENNFKNRYLDRLITQFKKDGVRLVLLIDRFETLLHMENLNRQEFFGQLRQLASSQHPSPLNLIIASNAPIWQLHEKTESLNPVSSPFFNFLEAGAITLGAIENKDIEQLLDKSGHAFTNDDDIFLKEISSNQPYLLEVAAVILIHAYKDKEDNPIETARAIFSDKVEKMLKNIFKFWSPNLSQAFISVAQNLDVSDFRQELKELEKQGFIRKIDNNWQVSSSIFKEHLIAKTIQE